MTVELSGFRILITGATGFVGSWLSSYLLRCGAKVSGVALNDEHLTSRAHWLREQGVFLDVVDVRDEAAVLAAIAQVSPDVVIHLAAQSTVAGGYSDPRLTWETNVVGTLNVGLAVAKTGIPGAICVTSDKCYEARPGSTMYREGDPLGGNCPYSGSKAASEIAIQSLSEYFRIAGTAISTVRFGNVIGGGDFNGTRLVPHCLRAIRQGQAPRIRAGVSVRPWQHVLDVCHGLALLTRMTRRREHLMQTLNFSPPSGGESTLRLATALSLAAGIAEPVIQDQEDLGFPEDDLLLLDGTSARELLGWSHRHDLESAAQCIIEWERATARGVAPGAAVARQVEEFISKTS